MGGSVGEEGGRQEEEEEGVDVVGSRWGLKVKVKLRLRLRLGSGLRLQRLINGAID